MLKITKKLQKTNLPLSLEGEVIIISPGITGIVPKRKESVSINKKSNKIKKKLINHLPLPLEVHHHHHHHRKNHHHLAWNHWNCQNRS